jgi:hypothetical protein
MYSPTRKLDINTSTMSQTLLRLNFQITSTSTTADYLKLQSMFSISKILFRHNFQLVVTQIGGEEFLVSRGLICISVFLRTFRSKWPQQMHRRTRESLSVKGMWNTLSDVCYAYQHHTNPQTPTGTFFVLSTPLITIVINTHGLGWRFCTFACQR